MSNPLNSPIIVWFRSDLRVHDNIPLTRAAQDAAEIVPVFIFDDTIIKGRFTSSNRNRFLLESLENLKASLKKRGGDLVVRHGNPKDVLLTLATETGARTVYYSAGYSPLSIRRDTKVEAALAAEGIETQSFGGKLAVASVQKLLTKGGTPYKVFTPFWKSWNEVERRPVIDAPKNVALPNVDVGTLPPLDTLADTSKLSPDVIPGGESEGRKRLTEFLNTAVHDYHRTNNNLGADSTSRLSAYLHFGCLSVREIETLLPDSEGARAWHRQLVWREFYYYVLFHFPNPEREFQPRYRDYPWEKNETLLAAWKEGQTGYPVVDAAMRQLKREGWMHNRARLIVGSFLTKDLGIDWREGEAHFMGWLVDGDMANNNGNWQWVASVGVDPAPVYRRLYNPSSQRNTYDPNGTYVRTYVPELAHVEDRYLSEPWTMPENLQESAGCRIGIDYPAPIVNHKEARALALEKFRMVGNE